MSFLPAHPLAGLYCIEPAPKDALSQPLYITWGPAVGLPKKKWRSEKFYVHCSSSEPDEIYSPMVIEIAINTKNTEPWGFIQESFVPQKMHAHGYEATLINWACYKIKQLKQDTKSIFLYCSVNAPQNSSEQAPDAALARRIACSLQAGFRPWRQPFLTDVATIIQKIKADQESLPTSRFLLHENDPGLIMVKQD